MDVDRFDYLMHQAGLTAQGCWDQMDDYDRTAVIKFAQLIVRECIDVISPYAVRMENFDGGHPITDLKKHFGVEE